MIFHIPTSSSYTLSENMVMNERNESVKSKMKNFLNFSKNQFTKKNIQNNVTNRNNTEIALNVDVDNKFQENEESFHRAIGWIIAMAQTVGLMPLRGVRCQTPHHLRFRFLSMRVAYTILFIIFLIITEFLSIKHMFQNVDTSGTKFLKNVRGAVWGGVFYGNALIATILFLKLASQWPKIMDMWNKVETTIKEFPFPKLSRRFAIIAAVIMTAAFYEQISEILFDLPEYSNPNGWYPLTPCPREAGFVLKDKPNKSYADIFKAYSCRSHWFIFSAVNYNQCIAAFLFVGYRLGLFIWNFTDLFIILVSNGLSERFTQFNRCVKESKKKRMEAADWLKLREHYNLLSKLVRTVDKGISGIVLLSFANNLTCMGLQITDSLSDDSHPLYKTYFFGSFVVVMARTIVVTISASQIHEKSKAPLKYLYNCSPENYCTEISRLQTQITTDEIALTGCRIFSITRSFILVVAGCMFTYVVVLMQFYVAIQDVNIVMKNMEQSMNTMEKNYTDYSVKIL